MTKIEERNRRVEAEKAWEASYTRVLWIGLLTYAIASAALYVNGNEHPIRNALIPTLGFVLSVQSLPFLKRAWIQRRLETQSAQKSRM